MKAGDEGEDGRGPRLEEGEEKEEETGWERGEERGEREP